MKFMQSHSCVLGSWLVCLVGQLHAFLVLSSGFLSDLSYGSTACVPTPVSWVLVWFVLWVKFMRSHSCALGSCLVVFLGQLHAVPLLCHGFLSGLSDGSTSCGHTPVTWVLVCFVLIQDSYSCVVYSCLPCLRNTTHAVTLLCPGMLSGLSYGSTSCGPTPVSWILVCFVFWVNFMQSHSCVLGSCLVSLRNTNHAVTLLCPGFLSGLSSGLNSCGPTPVYWVLVCFVLWVNFMRSHSCLLGSCLVDLLAQLHAVSLLFSDFLSGLSYGSASCGPTPVS